MKRIELLGAELDIQGERSVNRTQTIETKATFTVTAAAVVAGVSLPIATTDYGYVASIPLVLAAMTIYFSSQAIKPLQLDVPSARDLINEYLDAEIDPRDLKDILLEVRTVEIEKRDALNKTRSYAMSRGFVFLAWSVFTLACVAILSGTLLKGNPTDGENREPEPTQTTQAAGCGGGLQTPDALQ